MHGKRGIGSVLFNYQLTSDTLLIITASQNASNTMCGIEARDITHITPIVTSVFMGLAIAVTLVRCSESRHHFGPEDIFAIVALVCRSCSQRDGMHTDGSTAFGDSNGSARVSKYVGETFSRGLSVLNSLVAKEGFGKDIWALPFDNITRILKVGQESHQCCILAYRD